MGQLILLSKTKVTVDSFDGILDLGELALELKSEEFTTHYRMSLLAFLKKIGHHALSVAQLLRDIGTSNNPLSKTAMTTLENIQGKSSDMDYSDSDETDAWGSLNNFGAFGDDYSHHTKTTPVNPHPHHYSARHMSHGYGYPHSHSSSSSSTTTVRKPDVNKVELTALEDDLEKGSKKYYRCSFCGKLTVEDNSWSSVLTKSNSFYCNFCIRNDYYHSQFGKNILVLTFRGIFGYYYFGYYVLPKSSAMHKMDIEDYIDLHIRVGLRNPAFRYDMESYCWFLDFGKIGEKKVPIRSVLETVVEMLASFSLYENVKGCSPSILYERYKQAILQFYTQRNKGSSLVFAPTLLGCDLTTTVPTGMKPIPITVLQNFAPHYLADNTTSFNKKRYF